MQKKTFIRSSEGATANYSWEDIADGQGYVDFYLCQAVDSSGVQYRLSSGSFYSENIDITVGAADTEYNFNTSAFNTPRRVQGTAFLSIGISDTGNPSTDTIKITIKKVSGGVETDISSQITSSTFSALTKMLLIPIPLTATNLGIGDSIRAEIIIGKLISVGTDPKGRAGTHVGTTAATTTQSILSIPFEIDI